MNANPDISVVVLTHNRREALRNTLRHLCALPERVPIAVADNASSDGTAEMLRADFPSVTHLRSEVNAGAAGRNLGAAWASTRHVAFCDDDCWWAAGSLARACALFDMHPRIGALTARVVVGAQEREDPASTLMGNSPLPSADLPGHAILGLMAGATAFRTEAFLQAGGYDARFFVGGEETLLALDLVTHGWHLVYTPDLTVHHCPSPLRDASGRRQLLARNAIWAAWLRLPMTMAWRITAARLPQIWREQGRTGVADTLRGMGWVLRERRVVPRHVARAVALIS
ncbi:MULTISPECIES: glycosyltransferase family 2 protein [unclassified Cupriavidus]|uniref:glycosyltransferase family 2 protein n=1 Tax=Cupriavidus sp. H19C3 TaxID=3241603 RepID=UPI003BF7D852